MNWKQRVKESKDYLNYCFNEGCLAPEDFEGLSEKELVKEAERLMAKADMMADAQLEAEEENDKNPAQRKI